MDPVMDPNKQPFLDYGFDFVTAIPYRMKCHHSGCEFPSSCFGKKQQGKHRW